MSKSPKKLTEEETMLRAIIQLKNRNILAREPTDAQKLGISIVLGVHNVGVGAIKTVYNLSKAYEEFKEGLVLGLINLAQNIKEKELR